MERIHLNIKVTKPPPTFERNRRFRVNEQTDTDPVEDIKKKKILSRKQAFRKPETLMISINIRHIADLRDPSDTVSG